MKMKFQSVFALLVSVCVVANAYLREYDDSKSNKEYNLLKVLQNYVDRNRENRRNVNDEIESWTGRWLPDRPEDPTPPPKVLSKNTIENIEYPSQSLHRVQMGHPSPDCDDAKTNLTVDWDHSPVNHTCYHGKFMPERSIGAALFCERIPKAYVAAHKCMNEKIEYDEDIPVYGTHRPLWPVYGEYMFLPKQRWLHSLEHGAVVVLYHSCANPLEVKRLKALVKNCIRRHIITPYNLLDEDRPLAVLTWGCRLTMSYVDPTIVKHFIREKALRGPEQISDDGTFSDGLLEQARIVSDQDDTTLCPNI